MVSPLRPALVLLIAVAVAPLEAQSPPNLSGTWVLQVAESDFGQLPSPERRSDLIDHDEPRLVITRTTLSQAQESSSRLTYAVDGEPHLNSAGGTQLTSRLHWEGDTLVMISLAASPQGEITITDRYTVEDEGRTMVQLRTLSLGGQEIQQRLVLRRESPGVQE